MAAETSFPTDGDRFLVHTVTRIIDADAKMPDNKKGALVLLGKTLNNWLCQVPELVDS